MASSFAGRRRNVGLGRSGCPQGSPPRRAVAPATNGALRSPRRGTSSAHAQKCVGTRREGTQCTRARGTRPSLGPKARARQSWLNSGRQNRLGVTRTATQRGRANLGNQEEPAPWQRRTDGARLVTHHRRRKACSMVRSRKGRRSAAVVPTRIRESRSKCPHVVAVAEVGRRRLSAPNTLVRSAAKTVAARVNGGLARGHRRR